MRWAGRAAAAGAALLLAAAALAGAPRVYAHRGATRAAPENSLAACRAAFALGASCEVDVRAARDGALVLMHDRSVARTTAGRGRVAALTLAQLRALALRGAPQERVPTLDEALALARGGHALLLDLKQADAAFHARLAEALARAPAGEIVLGVRSVGQAQALRARQPGLAQIALVETPLAIDAAAPRVQAIRLKLAWLARAPELAARVRAAGAQLVVLAEGRGDAAVAPALAHAPDALLCDDPEAALRLLRARSP